MALFGDGPGPRPARPPAEDLPVEERLKRDILGGEKRRILDDVDEALQTVPPLEIINRILLDAMRVVGERFGAGEMQLPFVLESAEAMKAAVKRDRAAPAQGVLRHQGPGDPGHGQGRRARHRQEPGGDHPLQQRLRGAEPGHQAAGGEPSWPPWTSFPADAIGLSGLLVKSTTVMRENLAYMEERGLRIPVILGGAALTRDFVAEQCQSVYSGRVLYAEDAFEGLRHMDAIVAGEPPRPLRRPPAGAPAITVLHRGAAAGRAVPRRARAPGSSAGLAVPEPPFWGVREAGPALEEIFEFLDTFVVIRNRWSFTQGKLERRRPSRRCSG